jgi:hypothetical protein
LKRLEICTSRPPTHSRSTSSSRKLGTPTPEKQNAENSVKRRTKRPMHGGMPQRLTSEAILIVRTPRLSVGYDVAETDPTVAIQALSQTIIHLTKSGRFRQAADREKEIGQIYLQETHDLRKACESYERAAEWYAQEDAAACVYSFNRSTRKFSSQSPYTERQTLAIRMLLTYVLSSRNTKPPSPSTSRLPTTHSHPISPSTA